MSDRVFRGRANTLMLLLVAVFLLLAGRLWLLQVIRGESFHQLAQANKERSIPYRAPRGAILDRYGRAIASNRLAYTVSVVPSGLVDPDGVITARLSELLDLSPEEIQETLQKGRGYPYEPIVLLRDVSMETVIAIEERRSELPGVFVEEEWVRHYPHESIASHILGYLGEADPDDIRRGYRPRDMVGKDGIELAYESFLRGEAGERRVEVNALSRPVRELYTVSPQPGMDVRLTIDLDLQIKAEELLQSGMEDIVAQSTMGRAGNGAIVVLHAPTGGILAMASTPGLDLAKLHSQQRSSYYDQAINDPSSPMVNRALRAFPPGSIYKVVTGIAALEAGAIHPDTVYHSTGYGPYGRRDWTIISGLAPSGNVTIIEAFGRSTNDFFWDIALREGVGNDALSSWAFRFGLGEPVGLPLKETSGLVPTREYKLRERGESWYVLDTMNVAIGQGDVKVTPIQVAQMYMTIANEGVVKDVHLVKEIATSSATIQGDVNRGSAVHASAGERRIQARPGTWQALKDGLRHVVQWQRGTAYIPFRGAPYDPAGKTGTAENTGTASHGWFASFAPAHDPEIVVVVFAEYGESGARTAPIARAIMDYYFLGE